ncbi:peroxiredoxin family protein [Flavobacterium pectinovorum]|uniref:Alkyl hydroperoxide reductase subunit C/ Thiol specific antioxidant domain-containing protein n=1 Tax=Flavobacterium pectinovorum TaxID=29533 RepID=A0A502E061_9FLAO|nr:redoxin domain-containing protein [Flavobacterium pectinovorum]TPG29926.1 hypothetical protein EAH81_27265 [Flavobacterium pectinovorum]
MKNGIIGSIAAVFCMTASYSQTIKMQFANFAGKEYIFLGYKGDKMDTIASGKLDNDGKTTLVMPVSKKGYTGAVQFKFVDGGGVEMIVNNENFSVTCLEKEPNVNNIKYAGSAENEYLNSVFLEQYTIVQKEQIMQTALETYKKEDPVYAVFEKEKTKVGQEFVTFQKTVAKKPLYAARVIEMNNVAKGISSSFDQTEAERAKDINDFVKDKLNFEQLYACNFWDPVIRSWVQLQLQLIKDDKTFLADVEQILARIKNDEIYTAFAGKLVSLLNKAGKDDLMTQIGEYVAKSGKITKPSNTLLSAMSGLVVGSTAPALQSAAGKKVFNKKTIVLFYESGCNNCENEIHQLIGNYEIVQQKGYDLVTVSADLSATPADGHSHDFPWKDQFRDFKGFAGVNFKNYGVNGTPTFFIIDAKGKITGKYARFADAGIL